jgi:hypothetical protein
VVVAGPTGGRRRARTRWESTKDWEKAQVTLGIYIYFRTRHQNVYSITVHQGW